MATTTTNFGWDIPQSTDLVKDGATAIAALGQDIDTALVDLKGGTTGQVLAKATNTDLDYSWVTPQVGDITAVTAGTGISGGGTTGDVTITNSMATAIDAKGDLIAGTGADAFSRLAVGTNGQLLTADSTAATGIKWADAPAGGGWTSIASGSLSTGTLTLSSISGTYKNLRLVIRDGQGSSASNWSLRVNNNSTALYGRLAISQNLNTLATNATGNATSWQLNFATIKAARTTTMIIDIPDYANTSASKVFQSISAYEDSATGENTTVFASGSFITTSAISRLDLILSAGTFSAGTYILYGGN